jgi:hypothetical protein
MTRRFSVIYMPLWTITVKSNATDNPIAGMTVEVDGVEGKFTTDDQGKAYVRLKNSMRCKGRTYGAEYGGADFDFNSSQTDASGQVSAYPYVNYDLYFMDEIFLKRIPGVSVTVNGETVVTDELGMARFRLFYGGYSYTATYKGEEYSGTFNVFTSNGSVDKKIPLDLYEFQPASNGDIVLWYYFGANSTIVLSVKSQASGFIIDWGDGAESPQSGNVNSYVNYSHTYSGLADIREVRIKNCSGVDYIYSSSNQYSLYAYWSIGDSLLSNISCDALYGLRAIGGDLFKNDIHRSSFVNCFRNCKQLRGVPENIFDGLLDVVSLENLFSTCSLLENVPENIFSGLTKVTSVKSLFYYCNKLKEIKKNIFAPLVSLEDAQYAFYTCVSLQEIPADLFKYNTKLKLVGAMFGNFGGSSIPEGLFRNCPLITSFNNTFQYSKITGVPSDLFSYATEAVSFSNVFNCCEKLTEVPENCFANNKKAKTFSGAFYYCTSLSNAGALFSGLDKVENFTKVFCECTALESVDKDLFSGCSSVTDLSSAFTDTKKLKVLPSGLFDSMVNLASLNSAFKFSGIEEIPSGCFDNNSKLANIAEFFTSSGVKIIPENLFSNCPLIASVSNAFGNTQIEETPNVLFGETNAITDINNLFAGCSKLTVIKPTILKNLVHIQTARNLFYGGKYTSIPEDLFRYNVNLISVESCFVYARSLTTVPEGLFAYNPLIENAESLFSECTALETVPEDLFEFQQNLKSVYRIFYNSGLKEIPLELFANSDLIEKFHYAFAYTQITDVPDGLILKINAGSNVNVDAIFYACSKLKTAIVPATVCKFGDAFFYGCNALEWVEIKSTTPPEASSSLFDYSQGAAAYPIYVPDAALNDYKAATGFVGYASRIFPVSQKPA